MAGVEAGGWRKVAAGALAGLGSVVPLVAAMGAQLGVPHHHNAGGAQGWLLHVAGTLLLGGLLLVVCGGLVVVARRLRPSPWMMTAATFAVLYSPVAGWKLFEALNIRLDRSPAVTHTVLFVSFRPAGNKRPPLTTVTSWSGSGVEEIETYTREDERQRGRPVRVTTRSGALGREYITEIR